VSQQHTKFELWQEGSRSESYLLRSILAPVVDGNTNAEGLAAVDLRLLQLLKSEALASALLRVIPNGLAVNNGPHQSRDRAREHALRLGEAVLPPPVLAGSLVEPSPNPTLVSRLVMPVLVEMGVGDLDAEVGHLLT
jgi:hypothetical protein